MRFVPAERKYEYLSGAFSLDLTALGSIVRALRAQVGENADDESALLSFSLKNSAGDESVGNIIDDVENFPFGGGDWRDFSIRVREGESEPSFVKKRDILVEFSRSPHKTVSITVSRLNDNSAAVRVISESIRQYSDWYGFLYSSRANQIVGGIGGASLSGIIGLLLASALKLIVIEPWMSTICVLAFLFAIGFDRIRDALFDKISIQIGASQRSIDTKIKLRRWLAGIVAGAVAAVFLAYVTKLIN